MSYAYYDANGYVGDGPSGTGLARLRTWAQAYPPVASFLDEGQTEAPGELARALEAAEAEGSTEGARLALLAAASRAEDVLILSDGLTNGEQEASWHARRAEARSAEADLRDAADWDESKHPRNEHGEFTDVAGSESPSTSKPLTQKAYADSALPHGTVIGKSKYGTVELVRRGDGSVHFLGRRKNGENVGTFKHIASAQDALRAPTNRDQFRSGYLRPQADWKWIDLRTADADFEAKHPRGDRGRFAPKDGGSSTPSGMATIGMRKPTREEAAAEADHQSTLFDAQSDPLAVPPFVFGMPEFGVGHGELIRYVGAYGRSFEGEAKRPSRREMGTPNECYMNASKLMLDRDDLDYAEGYAYIQGSPIPILHGWCVTKDGQVIDPTPTVDPKTTRYFGVVYDRKAYMKSMFKQKFFGMLGADERTARLVIDSGAHGIRKGTQA